MDTTQVSPLYKLWNWLPQEVKDRYAEEQFEDYLVMYEEFMVDFRKEHDLEDN